jgi:hypothetical protein
MKRDEIKEQYNTSHEASSTVRTEPLRVSASETNKGEKGIEGEAYDNGNYVRERRQAL